MTLGCLTSWSRSGAAAAAGYDFIVVRTGEVLRPDEPTSAWDRWMATLDRPSVPALAAMGCELCDEGGLPSNRWMVDVQNHVQRIAKRAERLGVGLLTWAASAVRGWRAWLDGGEPEDALRFLSMAGQVCAHHGVVMSVQTRPVDGGDGGQISFLLGLCGRVRHRCVRVGLDLTGWAGDEHGYRNLLSAVGSIAHVVLPFDLGRAAGVVGVLDGVGYDGPVIWPGPIEGAAGVGASDLRALSGKE